MRALAITLTFLGVFGYSQAALPDPKSPPASTWRVEPAPLLEKGPSIVEGPIADPSLIIGKFALATDRPCVIDGDTLRVDGQKSSVRFTCLDAEETFKDAGQKELARRDYAEYLRTVTAGTNPARPPKYGTPLGEAAKTFLSEFLADVKEVTLEADEAGRVLDTHGRVLAHILAKKGERWVNVNVELVRQGLSPYFVKYGRSRRLHDRFVQAEAEAKQGKRGLHGSPPPCPAYPDYPARYAWWSERDADLEACRDLRAKTQKFFILGNDEDWAALEKLAGETVTVVGSPAELIEKGKFHIRIIPHRDRKDFAIVGSPEEHARLGLEAQSGNLLLLTGKVSLYQGKPQFEAKTVSVQRVPRKA